MIRAEWQRKIGRPSDQQGEAVLEGKESYSLRRSRERSIDVFDQAKMSHEGKDSHIYRDSSKRSMETVNKARSSRKTRDLNHYDEEISNGHEGQVCSKCSLRRCTK